MIRCLAIDIDGTLLDSEGRIPEENRTAIAAALARGVEVTIVTGRAFHTARKIAERLGLPVRLIVSNGALVKEADGTTLVRRLLPTAVARDVLESTLDYRPDAAVIFDRPLERQVIGGGMNWQHPSRAGYWARNQAIIAEVLPLEASLIEDPIQVMFNGQLSRMRELAGRLRGRDCYEVTITEYAARDFSLVDVLGAGVSKGTTLTEWATGRGYTRDELMAVGDNYNDAQMLAAVGRPVVMGNAVPELIAAGYARTGTNDEAGLAQAINRFILIDD
jgi:Cof subfamily protein (haloacid dehalogenase superfamily)